MRKIMIIVSALIISMLSLTAQEIIKAVKIIKYNKDYNFIVIDQGEIHGIEPGMDFLVIKDGIEIGKIEVVKVKDNVSACDIKEMLNAVTLKEDDVITIYPVKEISVPAKRIPPAKEPVSKEVMKERKGFFSSLFSPFKKMFREDKEVTIPEAVTDKSIQELLWVRELEGPSVSMDIYASKDLTFHVLTEMLNEHKILITHSNRLRGLLLGFKMARMGIADEIFADLRGLKEKKIVYDVRVQETGPKTSKVNIGLKLISYNRKEAPQVKIIEKGGYFKEIHEILAEVKIKAEKLQTQFGS